MVYGINKHFLFSFLLLLFYAVYKRKSLLGRPAEVEMKRVMTKVMGGGGGNGTMLITSLCQCDSVVLQKDDFQAISDHRIIVDHLADGCDQADNHLGRVVSRSGLCEEQRAYKSNMGPVN